MRVNDGTLRPSPRFVAGEASPVETFNLRENGFLRDLSETQFLKSWFEFESKLHERTGKLKNGPFLGLLVVVGVSVGFWTGIGFLVAHLVR